MSSVGKLTVQPASGEDPEKKLTLLYIVVRLLKIGEKSNRKVKRRYEN